MHSHLFMIYLFTGYNEVQLVPLKLVRHTSGELVIYSVDLGSHQSSNCYFTYNSVKRHITKFVQ